MKLDDVRDPKLRQRLIEAMAETDRLVARLKKEIPNETEHHSEVQSSKPECSVCHEPLAAGKGTQEGSTRVVVCVTSFRARLCDTDNLCAKSLVDGLRYAQLIPDDRPEDIELSVSQEKCDKKDERTEIELIYP